MPLSGLSNHARGLLLTTIGGLAISFDMPLIRLSDGNVWSTLLLRGCATLIVTLGILLVLRLRSKRRLTLIPGMLGVVTLGLYGLTTVCFLAAVFYAPAANVAFLQTFNPMFGALLSWLFLKERPSASTLATMAAMIVGVGLIVGDGMAGGHDFGNALSLLTAFLVACAITVSRASGEDMGFVSLFSAIVPAALGFSQMLSVGYVVHHPFWILLDGAVTMPIAFWCLAVGPRYLSAPEVGMFYMLETVLAPVWIWMIFGETPTTLTLAGGAVLLIALMAHSLGQIRTRRRAAA